MDSVILELMLSCDVVDLRDKRAQACVCLEFQRVVFEHMRGWKLILRPSDCTHGNARFIVDVLLPSVPSLRLYPEGETLVPVLDLALLQTKPGLKLNEGPNVMGETAAWFLGHALAHTNCKVRLTTNYVKKLQALRERERIALTDHELGITVNWNIMAGALLANAERRIDNYCSDHGGLDLSGLCMDDRMAVWIAPKVRAIGQDNLLRLSLSFNQFGEAAIKHLFKKSMPVLTHLCLSGTHVGCNGVGALAKAIGSHRFPCLEQLILAEIDLRTSDMMEFVKRLRALPWLKVLDLSHNRFVGEGIDALLHEARTGAFPKLERLNLLQSWRVQSAFWYRLAVDLKNGHFPAINTVQCDHKHAKEYVDKGLAAWVAHIDWLGVEDPQKAAPAQLGDNNRWSRAKRKCYDD